jgi:acetyl esterase
VTSSTLLYAHAGIARRTVLGMTLGLALGASASAAPDLAPEAAWLDPAQAHLDPQTRAVLAKIAASSSPNFMTLAPAERRKAQDAFFMPLGLPPADRVDVGERFIAGPGGPLRIRIYTPRGRTSAPRPLLVYFHGGGMSVGSLEQYDSLTQRLSQRSGAIVVSVDYRLTPENRFPAPVDDALAGLNWTYANAAAIGGDPARLAVGGDSAGGNLAAVVTQLARDRGGPPMVFQLLIYPAVGYSGASRSMAMFSHGYLFGAVELEMAIDQYVTDPEQRGDPRVFPILARTFKGLPPAFVISAECEIMRDDIEAYAARLKAAGVPVELHRYPGTIHPFLSMAGAIDLGRLAIDESADKLKAGLTPKAR